MKILLRSLILVSIILPVLVYGYEGGSVAWKQAPTEATGWYWMYDDAEATPPFSTPIMPALPAWDSSIVTNGAKVPPYGDRPYGYVLPDSFWFYSIWYTPGKKLYIGSDGWLTFDASVEPDGAPTPPQKTPAIPQPDAPNELFAALWADYNPSLTQEPTSTNRVWYLYDSQTKTIKVQWNQIKSASGPGVYTFQAWLQLGGQKYLDQLGSCGVIFSRHYIHFLYGSATPGWTADNGKTGIENQDGTRGILYAGTLANGRVIRAGYKKAFAHDVAAYEFLGPGPMVLRWTYHNVALVLANLGNDAAQFTAKVDIYNLENDSLVYHQSLGTISLSPGRTDTFADLPDWRPGEIGSTYEKRLIVDLANDECRQNDTLKKNSFVHCDDTLGYDWNFNDVSPGPDFFWFTGWGYPNDFSFAFYGVSGGLFTGGRVYLETSYWGYHWIPSKFVLSEPTSGCGATSTANIIATFPIPAWTSNGPNAGWNNATFPVSGIYVRGSSPGNIFAGLTPKDGSNYSTVNLYGMKTWPGAHACYLGGGPGRGALINGSFSWGGYGENGNPDNYYTPACELIGHLVFGGYPLSVKPGPPSFLDEPHDITACEMTNPGSEYLEDGVPVTPQIAIANIGLEKEPETGFFPVKFFAVDVATGETTFTDSSLVSKIGWLGNQSDDPDTLNVSMNSWTPEGRCAKVADGGPFVELELIGLVHLGEVGPDESDHCPYNDTIRRIVTVLLAHDVGVTNVTVDPDPNIYPCKYSVGTSVFVTATVENFGINQEHDIPVKLEIVDKTADPDTLVWQNIQTIATLDWRGNVLNNPYTTEVYFPAFTISDLSWLAFTCMTELEGDLCPDDDIFSWICWGGVEENIGIQEYSLEVLSQSLADHVALRFTVPRSSWVKLSIFDINGRFVRTIQNDPLDPGYYTRAWDARDNAGRKCPAGIYLVRMESEGFSSTKKVVILN